ncbi:lactoylglutathione lyase family protein [Thioflavicoccus mobilis 8321]|uniref:Lactoylglutathione lyase family protein n=1 Tax=Thioflavicoccus mobilis 8321 TaxID=765912 RepID=L0H093_9GAMM|nr:VOC family protein [Thioflavicoccus mobilis]AGA90994.1 lactoylglutathione lyase family protein [Thioflavicoccus mobilis 8321]
MIRYAHTNLIAKDWKQLVEFYEAVFECIPIPPDRDLSGEWLDKATGLENANIRGIHLRMPGYEEGGPTLEIFEYNEMPERPKIETNTPGFSHIAFAVDDVQAFAEKVIAQGGSFVGDLTERHIEGVGDLVFQYVADPEGNIIELQSWIKNRA